MSSMFTTERNLPFIFQQLARVRRGADGSCQVLIPDTLLYQHGSLRYWYFSDNTNNREVTKKDKRDCTKGRILEVFLHGVKNPSLPVAMYMCYKTSDGTNDGETSEPLSIEYFDKAGLIHFINVREDKQHGILQRFVHGVSHNNSVVQAIWTPYLTLTNQRQNVNNLMEGHIPLHDRCTTSESHAHFSVEIKSTPPMVAKLTDECRKIVNHFYGLDKRIVTRLISFWQFDKRRVPTLLYVTELVMTSNGFNGNDAARVHAEQAKTFLNQTKRNLLTLSPPTKMGGLPDAQETKKAIMPEELEYDAESRPRTVLDVRRRHLREQRRRAHQNMSQFSIQYSPGKGASLSSLSSGWGNLRYSGGGGGGFYVANSSTHRHGDAFSPFPLPTDVTGASPLRRSSSASRSNSFVEHDEDDWVFRSLSKDRGSMRTMAATQPEDRRVPTTDMWTKYVKDAIVQWHGAMNAEHNAAVEWCDNTAYEILTEFDRGGSVASFTEIPPQIQEYFVLDLLNALDGKNRYAALPAATQLLDSKSAASKPLPAMGLSDLLASDDESNDAVDATAAGKAVVVEEPKLDRHFTVPLSRQMKSFSFRMKLFSSTVRASALYQTIALLEGVLQDCKLGDDAVQQASAPSQHLNPKGKGKKGQQKQKQQAINQADTVALSFHNVHFRYLRTFNNVRTLRRIEAIIKEELETLKEQTQVFVEWPPRHVYGCKALADIGLKCPDDRLQQQQLSRMVL